MAGGPAPCDIWIDESDLCNPCDDLYDLSRFPEMAEAASWTYYLLSGSQYPGICETTVRPCARTRATTRHAGEYPADAGVYGLYTSVGGFLVPPGWEGGWGSCGCDRTEQCGCGVLPQLELGGSPIVEISEVKVDGHVLVEGTDYRLDDAHFLVRLGGPGWPCCQRLDLPATEQGTFQVKYSWGDAPPQMGRMAAAELCCELLVACQPAGKCKLPARTVQAARQGVTISIADLVTFLDAGRTGLRWGDLFLKAARSSGLQGADVFSPDLPRRDRVIDT